MSPILLQLLVSAWTEHRCTSCDAVLRHAATFCPPCAYSIVAACAPPLPLLDGSAHRGRIIAFGSFGGALASAIRRLKYWRRPDIAHALGALLVRALDGARGSPQPWTAIVPVPLHPRRLVARGYNQAALLAAPARRALSAHGAPVVLLPRALRRIRDTPPQADLGDAATRRDNVAGAFVARPAAIRRHRVLLIDDVTTTGATLSACASALHTGGASSVDALVLARVD